MGDLARWEGRGRSLACGMGRERECFFDHRWERGAVQVGLLSGFAKPDFSSRAFSHGIAIALHDRQRRHLILLGSRKSRPKISWERRDGGTNEHEAI